MIIYGCGHTDGNRHGHANLAIPLAGGGGTLTPGRRVSLGCAPPRSAFWASPTTSASMAWTAPATPPAGSTRSDAPRSGREPGTRIGPRLRSAQ